MPSLPLPPDRFEVDNFFSSLFYFMNKRPAAAVGYLPSNHRWFALQPPLVAPQVPSVCASIMSWLLDSPKVFFIPYY